MGVTISPDVGQEEIERTLDGVEDVEVNERAWDIFSQVRMWLESG